MEQMEWIVTEEHASMRIDKFICELNKEWSRTLVQTLIKNGQVAVDGEQVKSNYKVVSGERITVTVVEAEEEVVKAENIPLQIVYEDDDLIVINKERGMVVHPAPGHHSGTLVNGLLYHYPEMNMFADPMRPGIVHRIDKDTSGLIVIVKNEQARASLVEQLKDRKVKRIYKAIVHGVIPHEHGTINAPIGRDPKDRQSMTVINENSKEAITHFTTIETFANYTFVQCELETGRTHQIRVHMKYIGHPIASDPKYGPKRKTLSMNGQALHAASLSFTHPSTGETVTFEAELPDDLQRQLDILQNE